LQALLWPFATAAMAINVFLLGLIGIAVGLPALSPVTAVWLSLPLGLPATWASARWVARLIAEADGP
jgi:hypothetical protein